MILRGRSPRPSLPRRGAPRRRRRPLSTPRSGQRGIACRSSADVSELANFAEEKNVKCCRAHSWLYRSRFVGSGVGFSAQRAVPIQSCNRRASVHPPPRLALRWSGYSREVARRSRQKRYTGSFLSPFSAVSKLLGEGACH